MNTHVFRRVCEALAPKLLGARLEKIHALSVDVTQWSLYGHSERFNLILRAHRRDPFLFLSSRRIAVGAEPPAFVMRLRKYLIGQRISAVFPNWIARCLWLRFAPESAVWLCLDLREGPQLHWQSPEDAELAFADSNGVWPSADELPVILSNPDAWRDWPVLPPALRRTLPLLPGAEQAALLADLEAGGGDLFVYEHAGGAQELSAWPLPEPLRAGREETVYEDPLAASSLVGERFVLPGLALDAAGRASKPHTTEAARLERLLEKLGQEEARLTALAARQADALALQAVLYAFAPEEKCSEVDLDMPDGRRTLLLNPRLSVRENMAALFHQAGRGRRGLALLGERRATVQTELEVARARALVAGGMAPACDAGLGKPSARDGVLAALALPKGVQAFRSSDGLLMLRGRDAHGNLAALKMGRPDDLWLHAEGVAGAHVIVRRTPSQEIPERSLHEAGVLAALKSPYRDAGTAFVQCAQVRHVRPLRGAKSGTVRIDRHEPGLTVRIDPELEARLAAG